MQVLSNRVSEEQKQPTIFLFFMFIFQAYNFRNVL